MEEKDKDESVTVIIELEFDKSPTYFEVLDSLNAQMDDGCLNYYEKNSPAHMHSLDLLCFNKLIKTKLLESK